MGYRLEEAKSGRSMCRLCGLKIPKGAWRFGKSGQPSRWFHLACAAEGAPRSFKPFAAQAVRNTVDLARAAEDGVLVTDPPDPLTLDLGAL